jgi:hypothetical protein
MDLGTEFQTTSWIGSGSKPEPGNTNGNTTNTYSVTFRSKVFRDTGKGNRMPKLEVTTVLAVWGAIVSTVLAGIRAQEYLHGRKPHIRVSFHPNVLTPIFGDWAECCEIRAVSIGSKPVTIEALALQLSDDTTFNPVRLDCYTRRDLPATLTESEAIFSFSKA